MAGAALVVEVAAAGAGLVSKIAAITVGLEKKVPIFPFAFMVVCRSLK